ncbi:hypothetical protein ABKE49_002521 [Escherichia coli]|nr:hypothetical protein [Escherichia coli O145:H28]
MMESEGQAEFCRAIVFAKQSQANTDSRCRVARVIASSTLHDCFCQNGAEISAPEIGTFESGVNHFVCKM